MKDKLLIIIVSVVGIFLIIGGLIFNFTYNKDNNQGSNNSTGGNNASDKNNQNNIYKEVICSTTSQSGGIKITNTYHLTHKGEKLKKYSKILKYQYTEESKEGALRYKGVSIQAQVESSKNIDGIDITSIDENNIITNSYIYDLEKINSNLSGEFSNVLPVYKLDDSINDIISELKGRGYACK